MSLSRWTLSRLPKIKQGIREGLNRDQIAFRCGVTEKTIDRDMRSWVDSGLFEIWLKEEFVELHNYARDADPLEAYKQIAKIVGKMVTHKIEKKQEVKVETKHVSIVGTLRDYEEAIERAASHNLHAERAKKPVDSKYTNA